MKPLSKILAIVIFGLIVFFIARRTAKIACYAPDAYLGSNSAVRIKYTNETDIVCTIDGVYLEKYVAEEMSKGKR